MASTVRRGPGLIIQTNVDDAAHDTAPAVAADLLRRTGASWVVVTGGAAGAFAVGPDASLSMPAIEASVRHTHCAGAAFSGGLLYGLLHGWPMADTLTLATASGGLRCARAHHEPLPNLTELLAVSETVRLPAAVS